MPDPQHLAYPMHVPLLRHMPMLMVNFLLFLFIYKQCYCDYWTTKILTLIMHLRGIFDQIQRFRVLG